MHYFDLMHVRLFIFSIIISTHLTAQTDQLRPATDFDSFVQLPSIEWAAYINDTIWFDKTDMTDQLKKRFEKGEIKLALPITRDELMEGNRITWLDRSGLQKRSFPPGTIIEKDQKPLNRVDENSSFMHVQQVFYIANGKIRSYIPWISPKMSVYTMSNKLIGTTDYFTASFNKKYDLVPAKNDKLIFIKQTGKKIGADSISKYDMLKQLYGRNLMEALWPVILNKKNEIIDLGSGKKVSPNDIHLSFLQPVSVPIYDSTGNLIGTKNAVEVFAPSAFQQIEIRQNWYYDVSKNAVVNTIPEIILYRMDFFHESRGLEPVIKIIIK
jgi:hypothetical protein